MVAGLATVNLAENPFEQFDGFWGACPTYGSVPIVALHLTRPPVEIPDREALGIPSHLAAARCAYVLRDYETGSPRGGTVFLRDTMPTRNVVNLLPELTGRGINVRIVAAISPQLFARQPATYRRSVIGPAGGLDAMVITNGAFKLMRDWVDGPLARCRRTGTTGGAPAARWMRSSKRRTWTRRTS